nr:hypothetical protein [Tanacetum cinerariifolium]
MALLDNRIESRKDCILGIARGNLAYSRFMFTVYPQYGLSLDIKDLDQVLAFVNEFERSDLMKPGNKVFSITYLVAYALTSSHHSIDYRKKEYIEIDDLFNEIGSVEGSKFAAIKPIDESWAIDIAKNKRLIGEEPPRSSVHFKRNKLHIGETSSSDIRQSMNDECEQQFKENPQDFEKYHPKQFFNTVTDQRMEEPITESNSEEERTPKIEKINRVKTERGETSKKKRSYEFRMPLHKGIPNKNNSSLQAINILNLDCISDLNERKRILEKWSTEISLILQTNQEDFQMAKSVLTLIEHKTEGNIQRLIKQEQWNEDLHRIDFFDSVIDVLYTMFVGIDYHSNKDLEVNKEQDQVRRNLTRNLKGSTKLLENKKEKDFPQENTLQNLLKILLRIIVQKAKKEKSADAGLVMKKDTTQNECPKKNQYPDKVKLCRITVLQGYEPIKDIYEDKQEVFYQEKEEISVTDNSPSSDEGYSDVSSE